MFWIFLSCSCYKPPYGGLARPQRVHKCLRRTCQRGSSRYLMRKINWPFVCRASFRGIMDCWSPPLLFTRILPVPISQRSLSSRSFSRVRGRSRTCCFKALPRAAQTNNNINIPCCAPSSCVHRLSCRISYSSPYSKVAAPTLASLG